LKKGGCEAVRKEGCQVKFDRGSFVVRVRAEFVKRGVVTAIVDASARTYRLSVARYAKGIDNYLGVLDAQRSLYQAQQVLILLRLAKLANQVRLYAVLGGGSD